MHSDQAAFARSCACARDATSWGASSFCISLFVKLGIGFPHTRSAPEFLRSTSDDGAFPVQETITALVRDRAGARDRVRVRVRVKVRLRLRLRVRGVRVGVSCHHRPSSDATPRLVRT